MDAIAYLRYEHAKLRRSLIAVNEAKYEQAQIAKFNTFCKNLVRQGKMERRVWYPLLNKYPELRSMVKRFVKEEKSAVNTIKNFKKTKLNLLWKSRFHKFINEMEHYAEEEERQLFPAVRKIVSKVELNAIGSKMKKINDQLK